MWKFAQKGQEKSIRTNIDTTISKESQTSLDFDSSCYSVLNQTKSASNNPNDIEQSFGRLNKSETTKTSSQRNLTLEELEIEGFDGSDNRLSLVKGMNCHPALDNFIESGMVGAKNRAYDTTLFNF